MIRRRRLFAIVGGLCGVVLILVAVLIATSPDSPKGVESALPAPRIAIVATTAAAVPTTSTATEATTTTHLVSEASTTEPSTTEPSTTEPSTTEPSTTEPSTTLVETTTTVAATALAPVSPPPTTPVTVASGGGTSGGSTAGGTAAPPHGPNCTYVGTISIPATGVLQSIIAEQKQFKDGLLCGNHQADNINQGVDILPGFAAFVDSVAGGAALQGQVPAIIFGHRNSHNHPFREINKLQPGDPVNLTLVDGTSIDMVVWKVELRALADATASLLSPSVDGAPQVRLVACAHADGTPGGVNYRWIATLTPKTN